MSKKGKRLLLYNNYKFYSKRTNGLKVTWGCSTYDRLRCRAIILTYDDEIIRVKGVHIHAPENENKCDLQNKY